MKKPLVILLGTAGIAVAMLVTAVTPVGAQDPVCGPGAHWIDTCSPGGVDHFDTTEALVGIDIDDDCVKDMDLVVTGPVDVDREAASDDSARFPGLRPVDGHLDVIDTEIVSMSLTGGGVTLRAGVNTPGIDPAVPNSFGAVAEEAGASNLGDSFFDVFFEVDGVPGGPVYNQTPLRVEAVIYYVPPSVLYVHAEPLCLPLYDGAGVPLYNLVEAEHDTRAPVGGIAEPAEVAGSPAASTSDSSTGTYAALAGALAAAAVAIAAGAWYARRRFSRG